MLNLDTHILLKAFDASLTPRERNGLAADPEWSVSAIVLWEITKLRQLGRIAYGLDYPVLAAAVDRVQVWPITRPLCLHLKELDFASDLADEIIAATSLMHDIPLLTRDTHLRHSKLLKIA